MADDAATADNDGGLAGDKKDTPAQKKQVKNEHILIAVGVVTLIVIIIYSRKSNKSSNSSSVAASPYGVTSYGAGAQDPYGYGGEINTLANDLQSMQSEIVGLSSPGLGSGSTDPTTSGQTLVGSGYWAGAGNKVTDATGKTFVPVADWSTAQGIMASGGPLDYESAPGVFTPYTSADVGVLKPGTPLFQPTGR